MTGRTNTNRTKSIGSQNERLNRLEFEIREKEEKIKEPNKEKKQTPFVYTTTDYTTYDFSRYTHLLNFAEDVYKNFLLFDEAKDEQKHMPKEIKELEKRINPKTGSGPKEKNMKKMQYVVKNGKDIYEIRNVIINEIKRALKEQTERDEKTEETEKYEETEEDEQNEGDNIDLNWIYGSKDQLKELIKKVFAIKEFNFNKNKEFIKKIKPNTLQVFLRDILKGKITNKNDALEEYLKNINNDHNLLLKNRGKKRKIKRLKDYMNTAKFIIF